MQALTIEELLQLSGGTLLCGDKNQLVDGFFTDSRAGREGMVFLPVIGEHVDGHDFIRDAYLHGARAAFTSRGRAEADTGGMAYLAAEDTVLAFQRAAAAYRNRFSLPVVGITGSVGKTTTKEMVAAVLEKEKRLLKTEGNKNGQLGLPQMIFELEKSHELAVLEMGMSLPGEMERIVKIARPQIAIISNIGVAHIGQLKTREKIRREKMMIINEFPAGGLLLLNGDDELLREVAEAVRDGREQNQWETLAKLELSEETKNCLKTCRMATFGTGEDCDFKAQEIIPLPDGAGTRFIFCGKQKDTVITEEICLNVPGIHNVRNALAALTLAVFLGVGMKSAKCGLEEYQALEMRGTVERLGAATLIDDSYNASPDSMKSGLQVLGGIAGAKRRVAVLGDILELGDLTETLHREVGAFAADCRLELLITVGSGAAFLADEAIRRGKNPKEVMVCKDRQEVCRLIPELIQEGDAILIKGSRGMHLEEAVQKIKELFGE